MKNKYNLIFRKLNENKNGDSEYKEIKIDNISDLFKSIHYMMELLEEYYMCGMIENEIFKKIYDKCNKN